MLSTKTKRQLLAAGVSLAPLSAFALPPTTVAELTSGIALGDVSLGILAIAALMAAIYVTWRSAKFVISALRTM